VSLSFQNSSALVNHGIGPTIGDSLTLAFTMAAWVYPTNIDAVFKQVCGNAASGFETRLASSDALGPGAMRGFAPHISQTADSLSVINTVLVNQWNFLAVVFQFNTTPEVRLFWGDLDTEVSEVSYSSNTPSSGSYASKTSDPFLVGQASTGFPFEGRIATVAVWPLTDLTLSQLKVVQRNPLLILDGCELLSYYGLSGLGTQPDYSGFNNPGTPVSVSLLDYVPISPFPKKPLQEFLPPGGPLPPVGDDGAAMYHHLQNLGVYS